MQDRSTDPAAHGTLGRGRQDGTVGKALDVLDQVAAYGRPVRFAVLQGDSPYPKATLYRLVQTLVSQGMLRFDAETGTYCLGVRLVRLARAAWQTAALAPLARDHVDTLAIEVGQTVHLAQLDHGQVLYIDKRTAAEPVEMYAQAGKVGPAYCTGVGKAMLAFLPEPELDLILDQQSFHRFTNSTLCDPVALRAELIEIRARGHAFDNQEHEAGIVCIAMPILSPGGAVLGALSITATAATHSIETLETHAPALRAAARGIAREAAMWRFPDRTSQSLSRTG